MTDELKNSDRVTIKMTYAEYKILMRIMKREEEND